jgi:hypothetical protein
MTGRPSTFSQEKVDTIIEWVAEGKPLREFCRLEGSPAWRTVYDWLEKDEAFSARFARARSMGADAIAEEALAIADTPLEGVITTTDEDGISTKREDMLGHRRLQVDTRLKLLAKWFPQKYGEKIEQLHVGDKDRPIILTPVDANI